MYIGEFSERTGLSVDTLRYYDDIGLLSPNRQDNRRVYTERELKRAKEINLLKNLNFSLNEIKKILDIDQKIDDIVKQGGLIPEVSSKSGELEEYVIGLKELLKEKYQQVLQQEQKIAEAKKKLQHLINKLEIFRQGSEENNPTGS